MTANTTTTDDTETSTDHDHYQCPHCPATYTNETLTRIHVTRSNDTNHINRDGLMPEEQIHAVTTDGETHETITRRPADITPDELTVNDIPDAYNEQHKLIILAAAHNPYETEYTELKGDADILLRENGHETLSYSTVRRVIRGFYRPPETDDNSGDAADVESDDVELSDLTPKQQAILIATLAHPDDSNAEIAKRTGVAQSYPSQVQETYVSILNDLQAHIDTGVTVNDAIAANLPVQNLTDLEKRGLLDNINIDFDDIDPTDTTVPTDGPVTEQRSVMTASPFDDPAAPSNESNTSRTGDGQHVDASDSNQRTLPDTQTTAANEPDTQHADATPHNNDDDSGDDDHGGDAIPRQSIEQLRDRIEFAANVARRDNANEPGTQTTWRAAFAEQILADIDTVLETQ